MSNRWTSHANILWYVSNILPAGVYDFYLETLKANLTLNLNTTYYVIAGQGAKSCLVLFFMRRWTMFVLNPQAPPDAKQISTYRNLKTKVQVLLKGKNVVTN